MTTLVDLPRETLSNIVNYLSLKEKEVLVSTKVSSWITAVRDEMRLVCLQPQGDTEEGMNLNSTLDFVREYCPNLEHFSLRVPRHLMLQGANDFEGQWFTASVPSLTLGGQHLRAAITACCQSLKSFKLHFDEGCRTEIFSIIREARGLSFLLGCKSLEVLDGYFLALASMQQLADILNSQSQTLRVVKLDNLGFLNSPLWPEPCVMAEALGKLPNLQQLSLVYHQLRDEDVASLLGDRSQNLKSLVLRSDFYKNYMTLMGNIHDNNNPSDAGLSDRTMEIVARHCPHLQHLDVSGNPAITAAGIKRILEVCPLLQELSVSSCNVRISEWKELVIEAPSTLLLIAFNSSFSSPNMMDKRIMEREITSAIVASQGQIIFCETERHGVIKANEYVIDSEIAERQRASAERITGLIEQQKEATKRGQPDYFWSRLSLFVEGAFGRLGLKL